VAVESAWFDIRDCPCLTPSQSDDGSGVRWSVPSDLRRRRRTGAELDELRDAVFARLEAILIDTETDSWDETG
jgi:hypothetical protein